MKRINIKSILPTVTMLAILTGCAGDDNDQIVLNNAEKYTKPKDSGVAAKLDRSDSLAGTDSNNNGIRDDVDEYIDKTYTKVNEKKAARQMAKVYQEVLIINKSTLQGIRDTRTRMSEAISCVVDINVAIFYNIKSITLNTKTRVKEFFKYDHMLNGTVTSLPKGDTCEK